MTKLDQISQDVKVLRERLVEKTPGHFGLRHIGTAFFGALFFSFTFVLKGLLFDVGLNLQTKELTLIIITTIIILTIQIYFLGYTKVPDKNKRKFGQFWIKRITTYYTIAIFTSMLLLYLYGVLEIAGPQSYKLIIAVSLPAAIGAGAADLLGKY